MANFLQLITFIVLYYLYGGDDNQFDDKSFSIYFLFVINNWIQILISYYIYIKSKEYDFNYVPE